MKNKSFQYSIIEYRRDPTEPADAVLLGLAVEFTTEEYWVVALGMRAAIEPEVLKSMEPLTKELLQRPSDLFGNEIDHALTGARRAGDVLRRLAANNVWSIHVGPPKVIELPETLPERDRSVESLVDKLLFHVYWTELEAEKLAGAHLVGRGEPAHRVFQPVVSGGEYLPPEAPPVWMIPKVWQAPIIGGR